MSAKRPLPLWMIVSLFLGMGAMVPTICRLPRWSTAPPGTLTELTQLVNREASSLYVVPIQEDHLESGTYICTQPQPREQLMWLMRNPKVAGKWKGVVYCERDGFLLGSIVADEIQSWGEYGMQIGPLLFFGDPALLRRIHKVVFDRQGSKAVPN